MVQKEIEVILARSLASYLATPIFIVDPQGTLLYYNPPAEAILGRRFEETGEIAAEAWSRMFDPMDESGASLPPGNLPLMIALTERRPAHLAFWIRGLDNTPRHIEVTAFPVFGQAGRYLGAMAIFWEVGG